MKPVILRTFSGFVDDGIAADARIAACGVSSVARIRIVVVLPAPLGPMKPSTWPRSTLNDTSSTARTPSKCRTSPSICSIASLTAGLPAQPEHEMEAAALVRSRDAGIPERRGLKERQVSTVGLPVDDLLKLCCGERGGLEGFRDEITSIEYPSLQRQRVLPPATLRQGIDLAAVLIVETRESRAEPVDHADLISVSFEVQALACGLDSDLLKIAWSARLQESRLKLLLARQVDHHGASRP